MFALMPVRASALLNERPLAEMMGEFENLFNRLWVAPPSVEMPEVRNPWGMTTEETENEIVVRMELPGFEREELTVTVATDRLEVVAEHREATENEKTKSVRGYARVRREMTLPPTVTPEKAEATYRNGVLEVHLPRAPEAAGRRIEVKT